MKDDGPGMTLIVKTVTKLTVGLILIYGIYIALEGRSKPGGGSVGGVIAALSFIHLMLAFGKDAVLKKINQAKGLCAASLGAAAFLCFMYLTFVRKKDLLMPAAGDRFRITGTGILMPLGDIAIAVMVGASLYVVFLALVQATGERQEK